MRAGRGEPPRPAGRGVGGSGLQRRQSNAPAGSLRFLLLLQKLCRNTPRLEQGSEARPWSPLPQSRLMSRRLSSRPSAASWSRSRAPTDAHEPPGCECPRSSPVGARAGNARRDQVGSKPPPGGGPRPHGTGGSLTPAPPAPGGSRWSLRGLRTQPAHLHSCSPQGLR